MTVLFFFLNGLDRNLDTERFSDFLLVLDDIEDIEDIEDLDDIEDVTDPSGEEDPLFRLPRLLRSRPRRGILI